MVNRSPLAVPTSSDFSSQGTQIEQTRAAYDVMTAMEAAKKWRRDEPDCRERMIATCQRPRVVETAFWAFPRGREEITGPSVYLMRTLAKIWGNCTFGARELNRDPDRHESEMLAWAWDLQANLRIEETFIVPWVIDLKGGEFKWLTSFRDIRDALSNVAQRKVRTQIYNMLPQDYVEEAVETARSIEEQTGRDEAAIRKEVGDLLKPLKPLGLTMPNVLYRVGRASWSETTRKDLAGLRVAVRNIERGEASVAELFPDPPPEMTAASVAEREPGARSVVEHARAAAQASEPSESTDEPPTPDAPPDASSDAAPDGPQPSPPGEDPGGSLDEPQRPTEPAPPGSPATRAPGSPVAEALGRPRPDEQSDEQSDEPATVYAPGSDLPMTAPTNNHIFALFTEAGFNPDKDRADRLRLFSHILDREVTTARGGVAGGLSEADGRVIKNIMQGYKRQGGKGFLREYILGVLGRSDES